MCLSHSLGVSQPTVGELFCFLSGVAPRARSGYGSKRIRFTAMKIEGGPGSQHPLKIVGRPLSQQASPHFRQYLPGTQAFPHAPLGDSPSETIANMPTVTLQCFLLPEDCGLKPETPKTSSGEACSPEDTATLLLRQGCSHLPAETMCVMTTD